MPVPVISVTCDRPDSCAAILDYVADLIRERDALREELLRVQREHAERLQKIANDLDRLRLMARGLRKASR